jgi:hypothetical protein
MGMCAYQSIVFFSISFIHQILHHRVLTWRLQPCFDVAVRDVTVSPDDCMVSDDYGIVVVPLLSKNLKHSFVIVY